MDKEISSVFSLDLLIVWIMTAHWGRWSFAWLYLRKTTELIITGFGYDVTGLELESEYFISRWKKCKKKKERKNMLKTLNTNFRSHWTMRLDKFGSQLDRKSTTWFFNFLNVYVSWIEWDKTLISQLSPPKSRYFADQNGPKGGPHENEFWQFSNAKMNITNS